MLEKFNDALPNDTTAPLPHAQHTYAEFEQLEKKYDH
jgi:hypothetical protein